MDTTLTDRQVISLDWAAAPYNHDGPTFLVEHDGRSYLAYRDERGWLVIEDDSGEVVRRIGGFRLAAERQ
jgi:hypothetical protein